MLDSKSDQGPFWEQPLPEDERLAEQVKHGREEHLLLDPKPPAENNAFVLANMNQTGAMFWLLVVGLGGLT